MFNGQITIKQDGSKQKNCTAIFGEQITSARRIPRILWIFFGVSHLFETDFRIPPEKDRLPPKRQSLLYLSLKIRKINRSWDANLAET